MTSTTGLSWPRTLARAPVILLLLGVLVLGIRWVKEHGLLELARAWMKGLSEWIASLGAWGPIAFILLYVAAVVFFLPASILTAGAGLIYGMAVGSVYVLIA